MMLVHIGQADVAERVHNAWLRTIEDGIHTYDIFDAGVSTSKVGTKEFAAAVVERIGQRPATLHPITYNKRAAMNLARRDRGPQPAKTLVGVDVYVDWSDGLPDALAAMMKPLAGDGLELATISKRGTKVWPGGFPETLMVDHWSCRFSPRAVDRPRRPRGAARAHERRRRRLREDRKPVRLRRATGLLAGAGPVTRVPPRREPENAAAARRLNAERRLCRRGRLLRSRNVHREHDGQHRSARRRDRANLRPAPRRQRHRRSSGAFDRVLCGRRDRRGALLSRRASAPPCAVVGRCRSAVRHGRAAVPSPAGRCGRAVRRTALGSHGLAKRHRGSQRRPRRIDRVCDRNAGYRIVDAFGSRPAPAVRQLGIANWAAWVLYLSGADGRVVALVTLGTAALWPPAIAVVLLLPVAW